MHGASAKPSKTSQALLAELDWAAEVLTGDSSFSRIRFALPTASADCRNAEYNWDVQVSCSAEQDAAAQAAVQHVADRWRLAVPGPEVFFDLAAAYRDGRDAIATSAERNPFGAHEDAKHRAWARGRAAGGN